MVKKSWIKTYYDASWIPESRGINKFISTRYHTYYSSLKIQLNVFDAVKGTVVNRAILIGWLSWIIR